MIEVRGKPPRKGLKICCIGTLFLLIILIVVSLSLFFTVLKPKQPQVSAYPAKIQNIEIQFTPTISLNATLGLILTVKNRNYGSLAYENTTAYIDYRGTTIAEVEMEHGLVPARGKLTITTYTNITGDKLVSNPNFLTDLTSGRLNMTSWATLKGKVSVLKVFKLGAKVFSTCDMSFIIQTQALESKCNSRIEL